MQPPAGPPVCAALNFTARRERRPPRLWIIVRNGVPMGTSTRCPRAPLPPRQRKHLRAGAGGEPMAANQSPPFSTMVGMLAKVSTLLIRVGSFHSPAFRWIRRPGNGLAPLALDRGEQRRFLAANICSGADPQVDAEVEAAVENALAQQGFTPRPVRAQVRRRATR